MCGALEKIDRRITEIDLDLAEHVRAGTLTPGIKATIDTERDTLYLDRRDHKFLGHEGRGCPDA